MLRRALFICAVALSLAAGAVWAQGVSERQIVDQLRDQGFTEIRVSRTFLGRTRIVAANDEYRREIVINPTTGVILRDYWAVLQRDDDDDTTSRIVAPSSRDDDDDDGSSGRSGSGRDDDDDDGGSSGSSRDDDDDDGGSSGSSGGDDDDD
ncbi:hypothetical protein ACRDNQ_12415 [Palleronia sp. KMU-117]|uniref:hypothetical protein n=1 Tax=Palleronia sp. KMU-117 TaxID=3434108 RepID=UPI003D745C48